MWKSWWKKMRMSRGFCAVFVTMNLRTNACSWKSTTSVQAMLRSPLGCVSVTCVASVSGTYSISTRQVSCTQANVPSTHTPMPNRCPAE